MRESGIAFDAPAELLADPAAGMSLLGVEYYLQALLYAPVPEATLDALVSGCLRDVIEALATAPQRGDDESRRAFHSILYRINTAQLAVPWEHAAINVHHPLFTTIRNRFEAAWQQDERERARPLIEAAPTNPEQFCDFARELVRSHRSSVAHPLFPFLRDRATYAQLREFHYQETPLDICFADILCLMMAGLPPTMRVELATNYWDELGRGAVERSHKSLRIDLMRCFGISERIHLDRVETFAWEELALANLYLRAAFDRQALTQAIGIMLATELAVPGRVECQLDGCRRVGLPEEALAYLAEHVTIDVCHAHGWMDHVVLPLLRDAPHLAVELTLGMIGRLDLAAAVCDRMLRDLGEMGA